MTDGDVALKPLDHAGAGEIVADEAYAPLRMELFAVVRNDAASLLAAVLQSVEAQRGDCSGIGMSENTEDPTFLTESVVSVTEISGPSEFFIRFVTISHGHLPLVPLSAARRYANVNAGNG
jgi:hypothetical protein